ncbi:MAG: glycyl-radical enzyme activating protein [Deltaproteobacteria bacterium]|jgi:pyruvate formate lyase activating enzyme|nr:glycyl-radical enzyme activating protein [Deltaproteobacteria bacterium]
MTVEGVIFNVQRFNVHDGKGIRTIVFFKGCPLRCRWCSNPESQKHQPELGVNPGLCLGAKVCGRCIKVCPNGSLKEVDQAVIFDRGKCVGCFLCAEACPSGARFRYGEKMSVEQARRKVEEDGVFYQRSGGGLTISGGEALAQPAFALALLKEAKKRHIDTALETSGACDFEILKEVSVHLDSIFYDLKHFDDAKHREFTGLGNQAIIENLHRLAGIYSKKITVRIPVIPDFNDAPSALRRLGDLAPKAGNVAAEYLPYHRAGEVKYNFLGREYRYKNIVPDNDKFDYLISQLKDHGGSTSVV